MKGSLPEHISIARDTLDSKPFDEDLVTEKDKCLNSSEVTIRPLGKDGYDITKGTFVYLSSYYSNPRELFLPSFLLTVKTAITMSYR